MATTIAKSNPAAPNPAAPQAPLDWPLMHNNITRADLDALIEFLRQDNPRLTQAHQVRLFEKEWSAWLGVKHSVFVNSGSSANLLTMAALRETFGPGEVIVPTPDLGFGYRLGDSVRLQAGLRGHQSPHPRHGRPGSDRPADSADPGGLPHARARLQRPHPAAPGRAEGPEHPAHRGCLRVSRRDL